MSDTRAAALPTVEGMTQFLRRFIVLLTLSTLLGGVVGWVVADTRPSRYVSTVSVLLPEDTSTAAGGEEAQSMDTLARLVLSADVVEAVADTTGAAEDDVVLDLAVGAVPLSRLLVITFTGATTDQAVSGAQTAAESLIAKRVDVFGTGGTVVQGASTPAGPARANSEVIVVSAALLGLLVGLLLAALSDSTSAARRRRDSGGSVEHPQRIQDASARLKEGRTHNE